MTYQTVRGLRNLKAQNGFIRKSFLYNCGFYKQTKLPRHSRNQALCILTKFSKQFQAESAGTLAKINQLKVYNKKIK